MKKLEGLMEKCDRALKHGPFLEFRKSEIEFHRIIASVTGNPILMFLLDFVENLLSDIKEILKPGTAFSKKVLTAHIAPFTKPSWNGTPERLMRQWSDMFGKWKQIFWPIRLKGASKRRISGKGPTL